MHIPSHYLASKFFLHCLTNQHHIISLKRKRLKRFSHRKVKTFKFQQQQSVIFKAFKGSELFQNPNYLLGMSPFIFTKFNIVFDINFKILQDKTFYIVAWHYIYVMQIIQNGHETTLHFQYDTQNKPSIFRASQLHQQIHKLLKYKLMVAVTQLTSCVTVPLDTTTHVTRKGVFKMVRALVGLPSLMQMRARFGLDFNAAH